MKEEKNFLGDWSRGYCRAVEPRDKILLKRGIIDMLEIDPEGVSFLDLADLKGFSGDISMDVLYNLANYRKVSVWTECSELAVQCLEDLVREMVIEIVPVEDTMEIICLYMNDRLPNLPILLPKVKYMGLNLYCWLPSIVRGSFEFIDYAEEFKRLFRDLDC
jgi:hypothetical protein